MQPRIAVTTVTAVMFAVGCGTTSPQEPTPTPSTSASAPSSPSSPPGSITTETIVAGLDTPWDIGFLPDGSALITSRDTGEINRVTSDGEVASVGTIPGVEIGSEGGLLGLALAPDTTVNNTTLFVYVSTSDDNRVLRVPFNDGALGDPEVILDGLQRGPVHQGGRIIFGPDGMLYIGVGDAHDDPNAQDLESPNGKILRIAPDGSIPDDNPFEDSPVFSYGHRNVEGLAFDPGGRLWASEFGADLADELNLIEEGGNYGWPQVEGPGGEPDFIDPKQWWETEEASPSGIAYHDGSIYMAALRGQRLWRIPVDGTEAGEPESFLTDEFGRLRHVAVAPDGTLWVLTNNTDGRARDPFPRDDDDRILRITLPS